MTSLGARVLDTLVEPERRHRAGLIERIDRGAFFLVGESLVDSWPPADRALSRRSAGRPDRGQRTGRAPPTSRRSDRGRVRQATAPARRYRWRRRWRSQPVQSVSLPGACFASAGACFASAGAVPVMVAVLPALRRARRRSRTAGCAVMSAAVGGGSPRGARASARRFREPPVSRHKRRKALPRSAPKRCQRGCDDS